MNMYSRTLGATLVALACSGAQAAHFQIIGGASIFAGGTYAEATINTYDTVSTDAQLDDLSGDQSLFGFGYHSDDVSDGFSTVSYEWVRSVTLDAQTDPASIGFDIGGTSMIGFEGVYGLVGLVEASSVTLDTRLKIVTDGEASGSAVRMLLSGTAESLFSSTLAGIEPQTTFSLTARWGDSFVNYTGTGVAEAFNLSLDTVIGAEIELSLSYATFPGWIGTPIDVPSGTTVGFDDSGLMAGSITLAPVPEPETWAMLLGGLALVGALARRRA
ncbi:MAG: FxDxF family PEP-CTERM protein [Gammaproteobacteria bacterium]|nr:FxDxF family PEP-CTERM protein [Gammaproteobacteria bacterium]MBU0770188.1 FxDxF family PEP-CTERM protein [Gammaproteobacteria bacterium]MBU0855240.1 FxDxF family PEP-CTERM protein [Gammaproteobacteria bacterium]MBU1847430.1 FxDxF family PEP-CTERM protein [Gammaproteobacteria bacterium]